MSERSLVFTELSDEVLRELLSRRATETFDGNIRYRKLVEEMQMAAIVFAKLMVEKEASTDVAEIATSRRVKIRDKTWFSDELYTTEYDAEEYPIWHIGDGNIYGEAVSLNAPSTSITRYNDAERRLAIRAKVGEDLGKITLVSWTKYDTEGDYPSILSANNSPNIEFVSRKAGETDSAISAVHTTFIHDLEVASQIYTRDPFVPYERRVLEK